MKNEPLNIDQAIIDWVMSLGIVKGDLLFEAVVDTPWSYVVRFNSSDGYIYLKHTPDLLALEARIIHILHDQFHAPVPEVIAHNAELNCFLMKDAGSPLREILKQKFDTSLYAKAIDQFTSMQLAVADHVDIFIDNGVPDWRLNKLPDLYMQLLAQKEILLADGLSSKEINQLEQLLPKVSSLCQKLSDMAITQSIVQPDFSDNNTLVADFSRDITIIDLGEIVISHPFFSLLNCLWVAKKHHALTDEDNSYLQLKDACFNNYMAFESKERILDAFSLAGILHFIYASLSYYRLVMACDKTKLSSLYGDGRLSEPLQQFITACAAV